jgi:hypothetical protein
MPTFGVVSTFGLTAPEGYVQESSSEESVEVATIKNATGAIVEAIAKPLTTKTVMVRTKGAADLVAVHTGAIAGTLVVTSAKVSQSNDDFSTTEVTAQQFS